MAEMARDIVTGGVQCAQAGETLVDAARKMQQRTTRSTRRWRR